MAREMRRDEPGDWFHLINRGLARRTMFESRADIELFLDRLGEACERGWLEVHAYTVMATHFHLMVRSTSRSLSTAMHHIQLGYVRYFNRGRRRDGPLVRGRFQALLLDSFAYRKMLVGYIDSNAVKANVVRDPAHYAFASCRAFVEGGGPVWLQREWVESLACDAAGTTQFGEDVYREFFHSRFDDTCFRYVDERSRRLLTGSDPTDSLLDGAAPEVLRWMRAKAELADGTRPGMPLVPAAAISAVVIETMAPAPVSRLVMGRVHCLLLRDLGGLTFAEVGRAVGLAAETARTNVAAARRALSDDPVVANLVGALGHRALAGFYRRKRGVAPARAGQVRAGPVV